MTEAAAYIRDLSIYVGRIKLFSLRDWVIYVLWIGMIFGLCTTTGGFVWLGHINGVEWPDYVWSVPIGAFIFTVAIAIDTVGHRTVYKNELSKGESLVHHITIFTGITSVLALCAAYQNPDAFRIPALVLIFLSIVYSLVDEAMHWMRYLNKNSDRIEMWSHYFILLGHTIMVFAWWHWFVEGYPGVKETLTFL